ncbi:hypothetical protein [Massilia aerilata]|uniref:DUF922 domain-containing protein n=1 Tax=Massilia aerilata TaxID=453817 RepID=A0ABW0RUV3_9BURK
MRLPAPLLALMLLTAADEAAARTPFQARCEARQLGLDTDSRPTWVRVESHDSGYRVDNSLSWRSLTRIKRGRAGDFVLGLTRAESRVAISLEGAIVSNPDTGEECMLPQLGVSLSYLPIVIHVGSEFAPGRCAYREILAHEMRHLKAYIDYLPKVESRVRETLGRRFDARPVYAARGQALARVQAELDGRWMPFIKREMGKAKALQSGIDSPGEYARLSKVCQGEVQSLIGSTRREPSTTSS